MDHSPEAAPEGVNSSSYRGCAPSVKGATLLLPLPHLLTPFPIYQHSY